MRMGSFRVSEVVPITFVALLSHHSAVAAGLVPRFVGFAYSAVNSSAQHNCLQMSTVSADPYTGKMTKKGWVGPDVKNATAILLNTSMAMPVGRRAIRALNLYANGSKHPDDNILPPTANCTDKWPATSQFSGVWWEHGAAEVAVLHEVVLASYKAAGGELDFWVVDDETSSEMHSWWIAKGPDDECGKAKYDAIQNDKRFPAFLALLQQLGFGSPDMTKPHWLFEYMTCCGGDLNLDHYRAWATAATYYFAHWVRVGQAAPVTKYFPNASFSEYGLAVPGWKQNCAPTTTGFMDGNVSMPSSGVTPDQSAAPIPSHVQSPALYMDVSDALATTLKTDFGVKKYPNTPFNAFRQAVNKLRSGILGARQTKTTIEMIPYMAYKSYANSRTNNSIDYQEVILHGGLAGVDRFLMWNTHAKGDDNPVVSRSLDELEEIVGSAQHDGQRVWANPSLANWTTGYVLTVAVIDNTCLWRFTPDLSFLNTTSPAVFVMPQSGGGLRLSGMLSQTGTIESIFFPNATVLRPTDKISSTGGLWISQAAKLVSEPCVVFPR